MPHPYPLAFAPLFKRTLWGGRRLGDMLGKPIGEGDDYAESWEIVDHGVDQSVVQHGELAGHTLATLFQDHRVWLMGRAWADANPDAERFPLLLKYLDCNRVLSVQVHPNDAQGARLDPPDLGKTEAWVIVHSEPDSVIYAGLKPGMDRDSLAALIQAGQTEAALHSFHPERGDCVFIPAGTVHALGGGLLVAEIQQSSDTTFRLFDWNRVDAAGNSRPLHIRESLDVTDYARGPVDRVAVKTDLSVNTLVACDQFELRRVRGTTRIGGDDRCHMLTVTRGHAMCCGDHGRHALATGESVLIPASSPPCDVMVHDDGEVLWMTPS